MYDKESGLYFYNSRYYDPHLGSFISPDPGMAGSNHYGYCSATPIKYTDPTGLAQRGDLPFSRIDTELGVGGGGGGFGGRRGGGVSIFGSKADINSKNAFNKSQAKDIENKINKSVDIKEYGKIDAKQPVTTQPNKNTNFDLSSKIAGALGLLSYAGFKTYEWMNNLKEGFDKLLGFTKEDKPSIKNADKDKPVKEKEDVKDEKETKNDKQDKGKEPETNTKTTTQTTKDVSKNDIIDEDIRTPTNKETQPQDNNYANNNSSNSTSNSSNDSKSNTSNDNNSNSESGNSVICTELFKQGLLSQAIYIADEKFGKKIKKDNINVLIGYKILAKPIVYKMKKSPKFTKFIYFFAKPWSEEMAFQMRDKEKGNFYGKIIMTIGIPLCGFVGIIAQYPYVFLILSIILIVFIILFKKISIIKLRKGVNCE